MKLIIDKFIFSLLTLLNYLKLFFILNYLNHNHNNNHHHFQQVNLITIMQLQYFYFYFYF